jgi:rhodanese-related sulfurtransferase/DNA-directed RNA polymerase subunit RPC12/RpoP
MFFLFVIFSTRCGMAHADNSSSEESQESYKCLPCGRDCDNTVYKAPGKCSDCNMQLVKSVSVSFGTIAPDSICGYIASHPNTILLDVRTKNEFEGKADPDFGALTNAINIPIQELERRLPELDQYKTKEIIVYCSHSHRSPQASYLLTQNGFTKVVNMAGGMSELKNRECVRK